MPLFALGLNHKTAPVDIREQVAFSSEQILEALQQLATLPAINEAAILSTCNRTELYCEFNGDDNNLPINWFLQHHHLKGYDPKPYLYTYIDRNSVNHLLRVACGLDSLILGEPQILGQLKTAFQMAEKAGTVGLQLGRLFQYAFSVAKQVRTETNIGANPVSVAYAAVKLAGQIFAELKNQTALLIGAGETIQLVAKHLHSSGVSKIIIANRSLEHATRLAEEFSGQGIPLNMLNEYLLHADIVISSTASPLPILGKGAVESALKKRKHRPFFMVDIAVPRDIEPEVGELDDVYLYTVDDLENVIKDNLKSREEAAGQAELIIESKVDDFIRWQQSLSAVNTIRLYRESAEHISQAIQAKARQMIANGKSPEEALNYLAHHLTNKLLHTPTTRLREAAEQGNHPLIEAADKLFKLNDNPKE